MTNLILAVIYDSFKNQVQIHYTQYAALVGVNRGRLAYISFLLQLAKQVAEMDRMRRRILEKAFNLIDKSYLLCEEALLAKHEAEDKAAQAARNILKLVRPAIALPRTYLI
ncbi:hypothetical protein CK203_075653 [Vitis vinifera]|uniref:Uncharacterized protein n=1 Tax=Vitis vinifera TaxID=29760 RepID=A0A438EGI7_VITVI|nr:hypothetical protein CK203_075653 [Vitis vinifera]